MPEAWYRLLNGAFDWLAGAVRMAPARGKTQSEPWAQPGVAVNGPQAKACGSDRVTRNSQAVG